MLAHDPSKLRISTAFRFTEDTNALPLADSALWKSATALRPFRQDYLDVPGRTAAAHVVVEEDGKPVLLALRLKFADNGRFSEAETMTVRNQREGMVFEPDSLLSDRYPQGLKIGSFEKAETPIAPEVYRLENGRRMAGTGCTFQPPSCENMLEQRIPTLPGITWRVIAADEEMGLILL